ncbi:hypothetical protein OEZ86_011376 [Tetradesmus obliquus]|nr:hypothetical protein OEZ86_011376 [Tetradesmus obliquus]
MSGWLWADPAKEAQRAAAREEAHARALQELRSKLSESDEGRKAGQQLVQGGELSSPDELTSDAYLRKWLEAREWDVPLAFSCIVSHAGWRAHIMPHGYIDEAWIQGPLSDGKVFLQGCDSLGRALAVIQVSKHFARTSHMHSMRLFTCYVMNAMMALCDAAVNPGRRLISIFDMSHCAMANIDVACLTMILRLLGHHYVEQLDCMVFFNPPLVVWGLWHSMKGLLPDATRAKIKFVGPGDTHELQEVVPQQVLPKQYGGSAELLLVQEAVRQFKLPPYPHLPDVAGTAGGEVPHEIADMPDAAAEIGEGSSSGHAKTGQQQQ